MTSSSPRNPETPTSQSRVRHDGSVTRLLRKLASAGRSRAIAGVAAQGSQAVTSFALQLTAVRLLDLVDFGRFTVLYGFIVLGTALVSGLVGDPATVLDRHDRPIRAALQFWWLATGLGLGLVVMLVADWTGFLSSGAAAAFGFATAAFLIEDVLRRLLMANLVFWRIVVVDVSGLIATLATVVALWAAGQDVELWHLLAALGAGQVLASLVAVVLLPRSDRYLVPVRPATLGPVLRYGSGRMMYRSLRPATQSLILVSAGTVASLAAVGELGITRTYMAPAALIVSGVVSVLFAEYAARRNESLRTLIKRADRNAVVLLVAVSLLGIAAVSALPWVAPLLTGDDREVSAVMVAGWAAFSAAVAMGSPYSELASVRGRQVITLVIRTIEAVLSVVASVAVAAATDGTTWIPATMAATTLVSSLAIRQFVLLPMVRREVRIEDAVGR